MGLSPKTEFFLFKTSFVPAAYSSPDNASGITSGCCESDYVITKKGLVTSGEENRISSFPAAQDTKDCFSCSSP